VTYRLLASKMGNPRIPSGNYTLLSLTVVSDGTIDVGQTCGCTLTTIKFSDSNQQRTDMEPVSFNVIISNKVTLDENSTEAPAAISDEVDIEVKRSFNANEWTTICLPFDMTEAQVKAAFGDGVQLGDFTGYEVGDDEKSIRVIFEGASAIKANHPYIIKVGQSMTEFSVEGVTTNPGEDPRVSFATGSGKKKKLSDFVGNYVADFDFFNDATNTPLILSGGELCYASEDTPHMKAFQAYFDLDDDISDNGDAAQLLLVIDGNIATAISTVVSRTASEATFDLQGRAVKVPTRGIYVRNGRKIIVK